jgi:hypothetical protein
MSVIVYDAKAKVMASDSRAYSGCSHPIGTKNKIHRIERGVYAGSLLGISSSTPGMAEEFKHWIEENALREASFVPVGPDFEAILVTPAGEVFLYVDAYYASGPLTGDVFTVGSGKKYALGAWHAHQNAARAVEIAIECDSMCGGSVQFLPL